MTTHFTARAYAYQSPADVDRVAASHFGIQALRPGQRELIEAVLGGRDALGILPTGGGKSLCFQLPSLFFDKVVVVVSPLLALMRDQNVRLVDREIASGRLDSTLRAGEEREVLADVQSGALDLLYVTPEGMRREAVRHALAARGVALFVVDEAHCMSSWGHDFRPSYLGLADAFEALGHPPVLALTATATAEVATDITTQLRLRSPRVVRTSCERTNLSLEVVRTPSEERKHDALRDLLRTEYGSGIVYTATVKAAERVWSELSASGESVGRYHGELPMHVRNATHEAFLNGNYRVMVATKAFGMGIDKSNVRFVVHYEMPDSVESYTQEAGRAGRDGKPARAVLLYRVEDRRVQQFFLRGKYPSEEEIRRVLEVVAKKATGDQLVVAELGIATRVGVRKIEALLFELARTGVVEQRGRGFVVQDAERALAALPALSATSELHRTGDRGRLHEMTGYAEHTMCRWAQVLRYFGEAPRSSGCGRCDRCSEPGVGRQVAS
jgi:ATP-dependent DNA helicase RecQ